MSLAVADNQSSGDCGPDGTPGANQSIFAPSDVKAQLFGCIRQQRNCDGSYTVQKNKQDKRLEVQTATLLFMKRHMLPCKVSPTFKMSHLVFTQHWYLRLPRRMSVQMRCIIREIVITRTGQNTQTQVR